MHRPARGLAALFAVFGSLLVLAVPARAAEVFSMDIQFSGCDVTLDIQSDYSPDDVYVTVDYVDANGVSYGYSTLVDANGDFNLVDTYGTEIVLTSPDLTVTLALRDKNTYAVIDSLTENGTVSCGGLGSLTITKAIVNFPPGLTDPFQFWLHRDSCAGSTTSLFQLPAIGGSITFQVTGGYGWCAEEFIDNGAASVVRTPSDVVVVASGGSATQTVTNTFDLGPDEQFGAVFEGCDPRVDGVNLQTGDVVRTWIYDGTQVSATFFDTVDGTGEFHRTYTYGTEFAMTQGQFFVYAQLFRNDVLTLEGEAVSPETCSTPSGVNVQTGFVNPPDPMTEQVFLELRAGDCNGPVVADINDFEAKTYGPLAVDVGTYCLVVTDAAGATVGYGPQTVSVDDDTDTVQATFTWQAPTTSTTAEPTTSSTEAPTTTAPSTTASSAGNTGTGSTGTGSLPVTGGDARTPVLAGLGLLGAGALALLARRRLIAGRN